MMPNLKTIRHYLHTHPELSGHETGTRDYLVNTLKAAGIEQFVFSPNDPSFLAVINAGSKGKTVLFRCELDALPIDEKRDVSPRSVNRGISHKCGHDGHMTILLGLATELLKNPPEKGTVLLLFQSAEETGAGAKSVMESGILDGFEIDFAFALHNVPGYPEGTIVCKPGIFTPAVESVTVSLSGKTSHAGEPDNGVNPSAAISRLIQYFNALHHPEKGAETYFVSAPIHIAMGEKAFGTSAGSGEISYTLRTYSNQRFNLAKSAVEKEVFRLAQLEKGLDFSVAWIEPFHANENNPVAFEIIREASQKCQLPFLLKETPFDWGEDFGLFTTKFPGAMFGLGSGTQCPPLHHPDYNFPDVITPYGIRMFLEISTLVLA